MIKQFATGAALVGLVAASAQAAETYEVDPAHSYGYFTINHLGFTDMQGRIQVTGGEVVLDRQGDSSMVQVQLDPASVDTGHKERDEHLRNNEGFFEVEKYPEMSFKSTSVSFEDDGEEATVEGELTLHGQTNPVTLDVGNINCKQNPIDDSKYTCGFSAETKIMRSDYGMDAYVPGISDEVEIQLEVEANRTSQSAS